MNTGVTLAYLLAIAVSANAQWYKEERAIMGTSVSVELWDTDAEHAHHCIAQVMAVMEHVNETMSPYKPHSELSKLNRDAAIQAVPVSQELFDLIKYSLHFSRLSDGAFDITFASVGHRYDYRQQRKPSEAEIGRDLDKIDYRHLWLDESKRSIRFAKAGVRIDLGGIAKGHAVDRSIEALQRCGIRQAIVSAGGDSRILGDRQGRPWMTGIRDPRQDHAQAVVIPLSDTAISTSGDYERYFIENGERFHHILDPKTGKSAQRVRSATIIGPDATTTDALSTTVFILGTEKGLALLSRFKGIDAIIIDAQGRLHYSEGLMPAKPAGSQHKDSTPDPVKP